MNSFRAASILDVLSSLGTGAMPLVGLPGQSGRVSLGQNNMGGASPERPNLPCMWLEGPFFLEFTEARNEPAAGPEDNCRGQCP